MRSREHCRHIQRHMERTRRSSKMHKPRFLRIKRASEHGISFFAQEVETLLRQRHRFLLHLMGACLDPPFLGLVVTEFLSTTLKEWMHGLVNRRKERTVALPPLGERVTIKRHFRILRPCSIFMNTSL